MHGYNQSQIFSITVNSEKYTCIHMIKQNWFTEWSIVKYGENHQINNLYRE